MLEVSEVDIDVVGRGRKRKTVFGWSYPLVQLRAVVFNEKLRSEISFI
jgi:hypothetical protein